MSFKKPGELGSDINKLDEGFGMEVLSSTHPAQSIDDVIDELRENGRRFMQSLNGIPAAGPDDIRPAHGAAATPDLGLQTAEETAYENTLRELLGTGPIAAGPSDFIDRKKGKVADPRD